MERKTRKTPSAHNPSADWRHHISKPAVYPPAPPAVKPSATSAEPFAMFSSRSNRSEILDLGADDLVQWTLTDHVNTVRDSAKYDPGTDMTTVVNHLVYDAFGRVTSESNPAVGSLFLFLARLFDRKLNFDPGLNTTQAGRGREIAAWFSAI